MGDLGERLDGQASLSAQPEALRSRLQETGEVRSELELRRAELGEAERLCEELSAIVDEPYLREELSKRLEAVGAPLRSLEERAGRWRLGGGGGGGGEGDKVSFVWLSSSIYLMNVNTD